MAVFNTNAAKVLLPRNIVDRMVLDVRRGSVVAALSGRDPMRFGEHDYIVFNRFPQAQFVEESGAKASSEAGFTTVTARPHKVQTTVRFSEEVLWADDDYQLHVVEEVAAQAAISLQRALDYGVFHRLNPLSGTEMTDWPSYVGGTQLVVRYGQADADDELRAAAGLLVNAEHPVTPTGIAFDPAAVWALSELKAKDGSGATSAQRYPQLGLGLDVDSFLGLPAATSDTVSGKEIADTGLRAIVGDWNNGLRWGIQRAFPLELITAGDPDNTGRDLKGHNEVAIRLETVFAWYVDMARFAVLKAEV